MQKKTVFLLLFAAFLVASSLFITARYRKREPLSSDSPMSIKLQKKVAAVNENSERTDFIDDNGKIATAQDLGYATIIVTETDSERTESYYDEHGDPVAGLSGYATSVWEYGKDSNIIHIRYLDTDGKLVTTRNGYAKETREYNHEGYITAVRYFDIYGRPAQFIFFGYGKNIEYDEDGYPCRVIYVNAIGEPMITSEGYAIVTRNFYRSGGPENGKVESEFYFDEKDNPVHLQTGQYGMHKEYDEYGREALLTYLDEDGNPIMITKGYATVRRTFFDNNQIFTEQYYDQYGDPCSLPEGQYGVKWKDGKKIYLDANGKEQISIKNFLYSYSWVVIPLAITMVLLSVLMNQKTNTLMLVFYMLVIIYMTLMHRNDIAAQPGIRILQTYRKMLFDNETRAGVLKNIWLFIPLGAILYKIYPKTKILLVPFLVSIVIEVIQYFTRIGYSDMCDVISNGFGGLAGYIAADILTGMKTRFEEKKRSIHLNL